MSVLDLRPATHVAYAKGAEVAAASLPAVLSPALRSEAAAALKARLAEATAAGDTEAMWQTKGALSAVLKMTTVTGEAA